MPDKAVRRGCNTDEFVTADRTPAFDLLNQHKARADGQEAVVICSTDATYPEIVPALVTRTKASKPGTLVLLAGYPREDVEAFKEAGVDEFIHVRANCCEINRQLQEKMGMV